MRKTVLLLASVALAVALAGGLATTSGADVGDTTRVSVSSDGAQGNSGGGGPSISSDGRFVAFTSYASNLVPDDTNDNYDGFVHDRQTGTTERVSVSSDGAQGNSGGGEPSISSDGRFVAFTSYASNLVVGDTNGEADIFVRDRQTGATERVSVDSSGTQGNRGSVYSSVSSDGRFVAFTSYASNLVVGDTNRNEDVFVRDRQTTTTRRVSVYSTGAQAHSWSDYPSISSDGRFVAFATGDRMGWSDTNGVADIYVRDRQTGTTQQVSVDSSGATGNAQSESYPSISSDGRFVAFSSTATNLVPDDTNDNHDVFVHEFEPDTTAPRVVGVAPGRDATGVSRDTNVEATFSERVYRAREKFRLYRKGSSTAVDAVVSQVGSMKYVLNPDRPLRAGTVYVAKFRYGVVDNVYHLLDQNPTKEGDQPMKWSFKTRS